MKTGQIRTLVSSFVILVFFGGGCSSPVPSGVRLWPRGEVRRIAPEEAESNVRPPFVPPALDTRVSSEMVESDLIGVWRTSNRVVQRVVTQGEWVEEVTEGETVHDNELGPDGLLYQNGDLVGRWSYSKGLLEFVWNQRGRLCFIVKRLNRDDIVLEWTKECLQEKVRLAEIYDSDGYVRSATCRYDENGFLWLREKCTPKVSGRPVCSYVNVSSPLIMRKVGAWNPKNRPIISLMSDKDRKKDLGTLLKSGVITEEEYKRECRKIEEGGK